MQVFDNILIKSPRLSKINWRFSPLSPLTFPTPGIQINEGYKFLSCFKTSWNFALWRKLIRNSSYYTFNVGKTLEAL